MALMKLSQYTIRPVQFFSFTAFLWMGLTSTSSVWAAPDLTTETQVQTQVQTEHKTVTHISEDLTQESEPVRFGLGLSAQIPKPIFGTVELKASPQFSFALGLGGLTYNFPEDFSNKYPLKLKIGNFGGDVRARWHPFSGALFFGVATGVQTIFGSGIGADDIGGKRVDLELGGNFSSFYMTPHLGWMWGFSKGLFAGIELGVQVPLATWSEFSFSTPDAQMASQIKESKIYSDLKKQVDDINQKYGSMPLPYLTVLKIGYLF